MATKKTPAPAPTAERHDLAALPFPTVDPGTALAAAKTVADSLAEPSTRRRVDALPESELASWSMNMHPGARLQRSAVEERCGGALALALCEREALGQAPWRRRGWRRWWRRRGLIPR